MTSLLLIGAGFSRNWGGWLASQVDEHLPTTPEVHQNAELLSLLNRAQGFESALAQVQREYALRSTEANLANLQALQKAIRKMFADMDAGFAALPSLDFPDRRGHHNVEFKISGFLGRFDAIFSLNQDLLLERHYQNGDLVTALPRKWSGRERPGLRALSTTNTGMPYDVSKDRWTPVDPASFSLRQGQQPIFKLHGSSDWWSASGEPMLIMGGDKVSDIKRHPLLNWYQERFEDYLRVPGVRLMVIGYGGSDQHINQTIAAAHADNPSLSLFNIHPKGRDTLPDEFKKLTNIGASSQLLSATFAGDVAELRKIMRFFG
ncbi:hypothetical protein GALL_244460 [mine drainage metagenome]|uniref:Uncharacterized protein n=1 Tax=mine drainage metagenome TaxID=410659 RepID=A0A1J5RBZ1_9ZZZZ